MINFLLTIFFLGFSPKNVWASDNFVGFQNSYGIYFGYHRGDLLKHELSVLQILKENKIPYHHYPAYRAGLFYVATPRIAFGLTDPQYVP